MKPSAQNSELNWDIERYLLDDPTLDRQEFETRMLADVDLALAVAEQVHRLEALAQASRQLTNWQLAKQPSSPQVLAGGTGRPVEVSYGFLALAVLAASLLVAVNWIRTIEDRGVGTSTAQNHAEKNRNAITSDDGMSVLVDRWLAIQVDHASAGESYVQDNTPFTSLSAEWLEPGEQVSNSDANEGDWMLETAAEFFQQADT
jgi:hypothetical protein